MQERVNIDFQRALTNIEDGIIAVERDENEENIDHFKSEAKSAFDGVPQTIPHVKDCLKHLNRNDFELAFRSLARLAAFVEQYDNEEYDFVYTASSVEKVQDEFNSQ